jgi:hypothetical protein
MKLLKSKKNLGLKQKIVPKMFLQPRQPLGMPIHLLFSVVHQVQWMAHIVNSSPQEIPFSAWPGSFKVCCSFLLLYKQ